MSKGYVYILKNPSMPGLLKIGKTTRSVKQRCHELWQTGVPTPFEVVDECYSPNCHELERWMHEWLSKWRVSPDREFFAVEEDLAKRHLWNGLDEQVYDFVSEFKPDHSVVPVDLVLDEGHLLMLADELDEYIPTIAIAMSFMTADEMRPALLRWNEHLSRSKEKQELVQ